MELWWQQLWGETSGLHGQTGVMYMPVGKPRTVDSICLSVSIYFKKHFSGMFFSYLPTNIRCFGTMLTNKIYNCIKTMHKITPYKLFSTKFNISLKAFLTRAQRFYVNLAVRGWGYSEQLIFSHLTLRDNWLVRREEFVQDNIANWGDPGLVSWGELSATKRLLST